MSISDDLRAALDEVIDQYADDIDSCPDETDQPEDYWTLLNSNCELTAEVESWQQLVADMLDVAPVLITSVDDARRILEMKSR